PNMTLNGLMTFNGTYYTTSVPAFPNDGTFNVFILAYDNANNSRTSTNVYIEFEANPVIPVDPNLSMPFVVVSSFGLIIVVIGFAFVYDRRQTPGERVMQPEYGSDLPGE
ncbi:MAG: hypothetical protein ACXAAK_09220, partial [Candidatus Thorarchaeota archaeon]